MIDDKNVAYFNELKGNVHQEFAKKYKTFWDKQYNSKNISVQQQDETTKRNYDDLCILFQNIKADLINNKNFFKESIPTDQCDLIKVQEENNKKGFIYPVMVINY